MNRKRLPFLIVGIVILSIFLLFSLFPQLFTNYGRKESFGVWLPISSKHILGTNSLGYDIFTELVYGTRETLLVGLSSSIFALILGLVIGLLASKKEIVGTIFSGICDSFTMLPRLIVLIVLSMFIGKSTIGLIVVISLFSWVAIARAVKAKVMHIYSLPFIEACKMYKYSYWHIAIRHVLPNVSDVLISKFLLGINSCIMMESTLSFLGIGNLYYPTWGVMINFARSRGAIMVGAYQYLIVPCLCIMLISLAFYFVSIYVERRNEVILDSESI